MNTLNVFVIGSIIFCLFVTPSVIQSILKKKRYKRLIDEYKNNYSATKELAKHSNVYSFDKYKRRSERVGGADIIKYSSTHHLVWSDDLQAYTKVPSELIGPCEPTEG